MPAFNFLCASYVAPQNHSFFIIDINPSTMTTFLDYYKMILDKVSFDPALFRKEYQKAKNSLGTSEIQDLNRWLHARGFQFNANEHFKPAVASDGFKQKSTFIK
jgi:hypothetical protein